MSSVCHALWHLWPRHVISQARASPRGARGGVQVGQDIEVEAAWPLHASELLRYGRFLACPELKRFRRIPLGNAVSSILIASLYNGGNRSS